LFAHPALSVWVFQAMSIENADSISDKLPDRDINMLHSGAALL